jgi:hypothetical protein
MTIVCDSCGSDDIDIRPQDITYNENATLRPSAVDYYTVHHCICNQCFTEWVE